MPSRRLSLGSKQNGFAYMEVMLSAVLLAVLLVPALQAIQTGLLGGVTPALAAKQPALSAKLEEVLSHPFADLYAETYTAGGNSATLVNVAFSDDVSASQRRVAVIYRYDAITRALSSNDTGVLWVGVYYQAEGSLGALNTLAGRWW